MNNKQRSVSREPSQQKTRGRLHRGDMGRLKDSSRPQTLQEADRSPERAEPKTLRVLRVQTFKLKKLDTETWKLLRQLAADAARYGNAQIAAKMIRHFGYGPKDDTNASQDFRQRFKGRLSGYVYTAIEAEAKTAWNAAVKGGLFHGWKEMPWFCTNRALTVNTAQNGARITQSEDGNFVLHS